MSIHFKKMKIFLEKSKLLKLIQGKKIGNLKKTIPLENLTW